ncbi:hypothetical protein EKI60_06565 [Candidatus Saccharibacteria bacterium]|nr:MAG: hypothetical protein EKI60_06565 [Candidatus Saccharibacteria bacterium]
MSDTGTDVRTPMAILLGALAVIISLFLLLQYDWSKTTTPTYQFKCPEGKIKWAKGCRDYER